MLIEERTALEKHNLYYDPNTKEYKLPFDPNELNEYEFINSAFLGKDKLCLVKSSRTLLEVGKCRDLVENYQIVEEFKVNFSHYIHLSIGTTIQHGVVMLIYYC